MTFYRLLMGTQHTVSLFWAWSGLEFRRWGKGKKNAIIPLDLLLNQWHFKDNRAGTCQCVVMSYSEAEAPQWRSLCWEQRCEHFSLPLFCFSFVCLHPRFASAPHSFSKGNPVSEAVSMPGAYSGSWGGTQSPRVCLSAAAALAAPPRGQRARAALRVHRSHLQKHLFSTSRSKTGLCDYENMSV